MRFGETLQRTDPDLVVSHRHDAWLERNDHPVFSLRALEFAQQELSKVDRVRKGTVSASALGGCLRAQQFTFLGMPKLPMDQKNAMKVQNGSFMHLRWQMSGLTEGWLKRAEVKISKNPFQMSGTMDGILYDDSILELKSCNMNSFRRIQTFGPLHDHLYQMATYLLCTQRTKGVFIYECKDNQEYKEVVVTADDLPMTEAEMTATSLWSAIENRQFYDPLSKCIDKTGYIYQSCPYRDRCLEIHAWEEVAQ